MVRRPAPAPSPVPPIWPSSSALSASRIAPPSIRKSNGCVSRMPAQTWTTFHPIAACWGFVTHDHTSGKAIPDRYSVTSMIASVMSTNSNPTAMAE